jgi:hypothetical protein
MRHCLGIPWNEIEISICQENKRNVPESWSDCRIDGFFARCEEIRNETTIHEIKQVRFRKNLGQCTLLTTGEEIRCASPRLDELKE